MSIRAKMEAVVYAAEEPVTLAQLAAIFGREVEAELAAGRSSASAKGEPPQEEHEFSATLEASPDAAAPSPGPDTAAPSQDTDAQAGLETPESAIGPQASVEETEPAQPSEAEARRLARQTERAVREFLRATLDDLIAEYAEGDRGLEIREVAGGYRISTKPEYHDAVRQFVKSLKPPMKLSLQALETLAVVAYKQPVTGPEISEIRGVESAGVLGSLLGRKLITTAGRKPVIGRPILYKTTKDFLLRFGLKDLNELPSMDEFEKMAGALTDAELPGEETEAGQGGGSSGSGELDETGDLDETGVTEETAVTTADHAPEESAAAGESIPEPAAQTPEEKA